MRKRTRNILSLSRLFFFLSLISTTFILSDYVSAQTEEEMQVMRMYFIEDELVSAPTRNLKPLSQVAENMSVITAEDIEDMNAHTVADVLQQATGLLVVFQGHDFGHPSLLRIQGSEMRHVLVLLDGMPWNSINNGAAVTNNIPVKTIKRIEVIKGSASSAWGSSLGGVINIITKDEGDTKIPMGSVSATYGESRTQDYNAEVFGKAGAAGYYLYAGRQDSDGLRDQRYFERNAFNGKISLPVSSDLKFSIAAGYSDPLYSYGDYSKYNLSATAETEVFFVTASFLSDINDDLKLEISLSRYENDFLQDTSYLDTGTTRVNWRWDEKRDTGSGKLVWTAEKHTAVLGLDVRNDKLDETYYKPGSPDIQELFVTDTEYWALYLNDTIVLGRLSITPGVRYDKSNNSGSFTSPSLGITYFFNERTLLRVLDIHGLQMIFSPMNLKG